jgi:uncharacterized protein (TIGR02145 family)
MLFPFHKAKIRNSWKVWLRIPGEFEHEFPVKTTFQNKYVLLYEKLMILPTGFQNLILIFVVRLIMKMKTYLFSFLFVFLFIFSGHSQAPTNLGTDFWVAFPRNQDLTASLSLHIISQVATTGTVSSAWPGVNQNFSVTPGVATVVTLPSDVALNDTLENKGIHIVSNAPVSVVGYNALTGSADSYLAIPTNVLGVRYRVATEMQHVVSYGGSSLSVVATQNGTTLSVYDRPRTTWHYVSLNMGQTYLIENNEINEDMSGSLVESNLPVAVFGSVPYVNITMSCTTPDHIVEEMFPHPAWGKRFVLTDFGGQSGPSDWMIVNVFPDEDGTEMFLGGSSTGTWNAGNWFAFATTGGPFDLESSKPVLCVVYSEGHDCTGGGPGDPFMMLIPPVDQYLTHYEIESIPGYTQQWVNITIPGYAYGTIFMDGVLIPNINFIPVGSNKYYAAELPITDGFHTFTSIYPFGLCVYGAGTEISYAHPGGCNFSPIEHVDSVILTPAISYGVLNSSTLCLNAHVQDSLSNPVPGVLVTFHLSGISDTTGIGYTDAAGNTQFCYARTGIIEGTDSIYADCNTYLSDTVLAIWSLIPPCINPTDGGGIGKSQSGCGSFTPDSLTSTMHPSGQTGTLEYKWQKSTTSAFTSFTDIPGTNTAGYAPGTIAQTTWYRRLARVTCMTDWSGAALSNTLEIAVVTPVVPSITILANHLQLCAGDSVHLTATGLNGGTNPLYQWKVNGVLAGTNSLTYAYVPNTSDVVTCTLTSSDTCTSGNPATSNAVILTVNPYLPVSVTISVVSNPFCIGSTVTFTATPTNGGIVPDYQWVYNGIHAGLNNPVFTFTPADGDCIYCVLTSTIDCPVGNPDTSNIICLTGLPALPVSVSITASSDPVCAGTQVIFTATPVNGGTLPYYQWFVNGIPIGTHINTLSYIPVTGDCINCELTSNLVCASGNPATSNTICMTVNPNQPVSITISPSANPVCAGTQVTFTATPINPGTLPGYQWKVNGGIVGINSSTYSYNPASGDLVSCILTSNAICATGNPATSNTISMSVNPNLPVSISIAASNNPVCAGIPVTFTATPVNGGPTPVYHWKVNGINVGTNNPTYQYIPVNGDIVTCVLTSSVSCPIGNPASSNTIMMNISSLPVVTFTRCFDSITTTTAQPFKLKGGIPLGGTYLGAGVAGGIFHPAIAGVGSHQITYSYTNAALCSASASVTVVTVVTVVTNCGQPLTDIRDGKTYQTVHIGNQCWLAEDLNYGTEISSNLDQRDNCMPEKYHHPASSIEHPASVYQWDEIMTYGTSLADQGLCPPGWHVPSEADWNTLFAEYTNNGFAASPLKYSGFSGFNALLNGALHLNEKWDYAGFATFFWSSTANSTLKAWAHGINEPDPSVSAYPAFRTNAFSVRCLRDN